MYVNAVAMTDGGGGSRTIGTTKYYLSDSEYKDVMECLDSFSDKCSAYISMWEKAITPGTNSFDKRTIDHFLDGTYNMKYNNDGILSDLKDKLKKINSFENYLEEEQRKMLALDRRLAGHDGSGSSRPSYMPSVPIAPTVPPREDQYAIPISAFDSLSAEDKQDLIALLRRLGFTEEEINNFKEGKLKVNKMTLGKLKAEFANLKHDYPSFYNKIEEILGFSLYNDDGTISEERLAILMALCGKGLGYEVDLTEGSTFRTLLDGYAERLMAAYKNDPSIRQVFIDKYGIDIFNDDGTVDIEKLAMVKMMDGLDKEHYNLESLIPNNNTSPSSSAEPSPTQPVTQHTPDITIEPPATKPPATEPPTPDNTNPISISSGSHANDVIGSSTVDTGSSHATIGKIDTNMKPLAGAAASAKEGLSMAGSKIMNAISSGANNISKKLINPSSLKLATEKISTNKASVGIIAAAGLAAGGTLAGGGIMLGKKMHYIKFTPDNWLALPEDMQATIEKLMIDAGFDEEELETFKNSCFKIRADELKTHTKKIEQTAKNSTDSEEELVKQYNYSIIDETGKADNYLTFITMIIDGKNSVDSYNMYSILNKHLEATNDADFVYMGINMEDYIDEEDDIDSIIEINDPSIQKLDDGDVAQDDALDLETSSDDESNFDFDEDEIDEDEVGFDSNIEEEKPEDEVDFSSIANDEHFDSEEAGFGQDAIGGGYELADDTPSAPQSLNEQIAEKEWLKSIGIDD